MATKTISIDLEAYRRLKQVQKENESFSQTIKRVVKPRPEVRDWLKRASKVRFSKEFVEAVEEQIRSRSNGTRRLSRSA
jgi:predicted CopG family antitoxin